MKKILFTLFFYLSYVQVWAEEEKQQDPGIFKWCLSGSEVRNGDATLETIPCVIKQLIDLFLGLSGTIAVIFVILGGYKIMFGALERDPTEWKKMVGLALAGFVIASLAWVIVKFTLTGFTL